MCSGYAGCERTRVLSDASHEHVAAGIMARGAVAHACRPPDCFSRYEPGTPDHDGLFGRDHRSQLVHVFSPDGGAQTIATMGTAPGAVLNWFVAPILAATLYLALCPAGSQSAPTEDRADRSAQ
jgi:hypothetical protein